MAHRRFPKFQLLRRPPILRPTDDTEDEYERSLVGKMQPRG
jgi:hypothetical protein